jgi:hypothetical protein
VGVVVATRPNDDPKKTSGKTAVAAGKNLAAVRGLSLTGTYGGNQATFTVTKDGSTRGSYNAGGSPVSLVLVNGVTYLKANSTYWVSKGQSSTLADKSDGTWTKDTIGAVTLKFANLTPPALAGALRTAGNDPHAVKTKVNGVKAIRMTKNGTVYYISSKQHQLLRIDGTAGSDGYSFTVSPLNASALGTVFTGFRGDIKDLAGAYDPNVTALVTSKTKFGSCTEAGCTVSGTATTTALGESPSPTILLKMTIKFSATTGGTPVATCTDSSTTTAPQTVTLSCRTSGGSWSSWYSSQSGEFTVHALASFDTTVNNAADVNQLLNQIGQEQQGA